MRRAVKIGIAVVAGLIALLLLNALALSNETREAELNADGAELIETSVGTYQVLERGPDSGPDVVLLHCFTCSLKWWERIEPALSARNHVVMVDLLGHGGSEKPKDGYTIAEQADGITEVLAKLEVSDATVVGHSLGGAVAAEIAIQSPELAPRLMTIGTSPAPGLSSLSLTARLATAPLLGPALARVSDLAPSSFLRSQLEQAFAPGFNLAEGFDNPDQAVDDYRELTYSAYKKSSQGFDDYQEEHSLASRLKESGVDTVAVFGSEDEILADEDAAVAEYATVPNAESEVLEGIGHSPSVEAPDLLAPLILGMVSDGLAEARLERERAEAKKRAAEKKRAAAKRRAEKARAGRRARQAKREPGK